MNFYKHHLGDYDGDTVHLSWDEDMAYTRLLRAYYRKESPIQPAEAWRLARATTKAQREAVDRVLSEFFTRQDDGWHNSRADREITAYRNQATTNRRIARERTVQRTGNESLNESLTNRPPNQNPEPEKTTTPLPPSGAFAGFWTAWPKNERKGAKGKCWALWRRSNFDTVSAEIVAHVETMKATEQWRGGFIPAPLVYLNQRRWEGAESPAAADEPRQLRVAL